LKSYLLVVSHPDDEVLGAGGLIWRLSSQGYAVNLCILSGSVSARFLKPPNNELNQNLIDSCKFLGVKNIKVGNFPNIEFNIIPHIKLVEFIEGAISEFEPTTVITHHPSDLNNDHYFTSIAVQAAIRLPQRQSGIKPIEELLFMEVLSSTEWNINDSFNVFKPNYFVEIGKDGLEKKISALKIYKNVSRPFPHPRSKEAISGLAAYRGGQSGLNYAEAFQLVFSKTNI
jgi:LmbE family N-acetylglucosaminyl deacetylase